ncbi:MAG: cation-transporting P-type ATPase [Candidatus Promineifilaceae bacterium]|nr:cation-transporting P-type ATPase [Candidatus Promineifilaceae bacterium]
MSDITLPSQPWTQSAAEITDSLAVDPEQGLDEQEAKQRREQFGRNRLRKAEARSVWQILLDQFKSLVVLLLIVAAALSFTFGEVIDGLAILAVVVINALIGFFTELRAVRSMEALQEIGDVEARVRRGGAARQIDAEELVPGDILILESGDVVTADVRLLEAAKLQVNESALTGESVPVGKQTKAVAAEVPLAERDTMAYKGTAITRGSGIGVVVNTGMKTELGEITSLVEQAEQEETPLEERLDKLGQRLVVVTLGIAALVAAVGIIRGRETLQMIETAIALAVAAIPEGLPIVATIALARGMRRMAKRNALVNRLAAVETLGGTNIICADKTGTLTENQMTLTEMALTSEEVKVSGEGLEREGTFSSDDRELDPGEHEILRRALEIGVLCNNAALTEVDEDDPDSDFEEIGDPVEVALLVAGSKAGLKRKSLLEELPEEREVAFDPDVKMMATFHQTGDGYRVAVKGAPEAVLDVSHRRLTRDGPVALDEEARRSWLDRNREMAEEGLRVLAVAERQADDVDVDPYQELTFLGLVGLLDPPREEVRDAIQSCQQAGIRVVMITGDQAATARKVALAVGLVDDEQVEVLEGSELRELDGQGDKQERVTGAPILARVSPKQKLDLIDIYQAQGLVVAMTGDGVNDAPALKKADIGVAMGRRGTQVAQEVADMVLQDDAFSTIVAAVEQGRAIFNNIRKFVLYLLSCNLSEIFTVGLASLVGLPLPILPLQILFLNLVTDVFPALALGVGEAEEGTMERPPRDPDEEIMMRHHWMAIGGYGLLITLAVLGALMLALNWLDMGRDAAVTVSFLTLASAQLWHVFDMRDTGTSILRNEITANPYVWGALGLCVVLLLLAVYLPGLSDVLSTVPLGLDGWLVVAGMSIAPVIVGQVLKEFDIGKI